MKPTHSVEEARGDARHFSDAEIEAIGVICATAMTLQALIELIYLSMGLGS